MTATPPRVDLRTLAAEALRDNDFLDLVPLEFRTPFLDAVLAAVLPAVAGAILTVADAPTTPVEQKPGLYRAADVVKRLAETAPPVPEATPGGFHEPDEPTDHIRAAFAAGAHGRTAPPRGQTRRLDVAALTYGEMESERDRLAGELYEANCELAALKSKPLFSTRQVMRVLLKAAGDEVTDQELTLRIDDGLTLAGAVDLVLATLALTEQERLWSRRAYEETKADRDRLAAQVTQCQRVIEAAKAWRAMRLGTPTQPKPESSALIAAVDALPDAGTGQTEVQT